MQIRVNIANNAYRISLLCQKVSVMKVLTNCKHLIFFQNLQVINNMIRLKNDSKLDGKLDFTGKRKLEADSSDESMVSPPKRLNLFRRLQDLNSDRQEQKVVIVK